jgi:hypothetical protein
MGAQLWKNLVVSLAIVAAICPSAFSDGRVSDQTLADMGLGGLTVVSDNEAMSVRGHGYKGGSSVRIFGNSSATINTRHGSASSENGYNVSGKHFAAGGNISFAGVVKKSSGGGGHHKRGGKSGGFKSVKVFAGGGSFGIAF